MKLGVIGCGKMGTALVKGAIQARAVLASDVTGIDLLKDARDFFEKATGARTSAGIDALADCDVMLLCTNRLMRWLPCTRHPKPVRANPCW